MLPQSRQDTGLYPSPLFSIEKVDVEGCLDELYEFHAMFEDCFVRSEPRENFLRYMVGLMSPLESKTIEPIALHVRGGNVRCMQNAISDAIWDEDKMLSRYHMQVREDLGGPDGVLIFDESGSVKKGVDSAGVARQYCGSVGKVENSQVGVFAAYASRHGYSLVGEKLFIPEGWFDDSHKDKMDKLNFPQGLSFKTKPQIAAEMFEQLLDRLPFKYVTADSIYGESQDFLKVIEAHVGIIYFVQVSADTRFWLQRPLTEIKTYRYDGKECSKKIVPKTEKKPIRADQFARNLHNCFWYRRTVCEGAKGAIVYEFTKRQVILCKDGLPQKTVWMVIKRNTDKEDRRYWFHISNAPLSIRLKTFVWLSGIRWAIEQCFEEGKSELGMDDYEVRKYPAWNRHMLTCMLVHFFLWHLRIQLEHKAPLLTLSQLRLLLKAVLPLRVYDITDLIFLVQWIQMKNQRAYISHRKRTLVEAPV